MEKKLDLASVSCPGPSVQDIVARSGDAPPFPLNIRSNPDLGQDDVPFARYTSTDFFKAESDKLWSRTWQWACREEHIPEVGDYVTYDVTRYSLIVMRTASDTHPSVSQCLPSPRHQTPAIVFRGFSERDKVLLSWVVLEY